MLKIVKIRGVAEMLKLYNVNLKLNKINISVKYVLETIL